LSTWYVDSSALVKLIVEEASSAAVERFLRGQACISSDLARAEVVRAARRCSPEATAEARAVLRALDLISISADVYDAAGVIGRPALRTLDAVHLACALQLGDELAGVVTYDERLARAAAELGLSVVAPTDQ
jgi:uncharacterized protein